MALPTFCLARNYAEDNYPSDERELVGFFLKNDDVGRHLVEVEMKDTLYHLLGHDIERNDKEYRRNMRHGAKCYMAWDGKLFCRQGRQVRFVPKITNRVLILKQFHDDIGRWGRLPTKQFVTDRFWFPGVIKDFYEYVRSCHGCQLLHSIAYRKVLKFRSLACLMAYLSTLTERL